VGVSRLYHITPAAEWTASREAGEYRGSTRGKSLADVGFIHTSHTHQVTRVADAIYRGTPGLVLLVIDPAAVRAEIREEPLPGTGERFPHIYGPLNADAVVDVLPFEPAADGTFELPSGLRVGLKLAAQEGLVPGDTFAEKLANLHAYGFDGVEVNGRDLPARLPEVRVALAESPLKASTICGGFPAYFTCPEQEKRAQSVAAVRELLRCAAELGTAGVIFVPRFNRDAGPPDLSPLATVERLERELFVAVVRPLAREAADLGVAMILEPLNRYEARFPKDLAEGVSICEEVDSPGLRLMGDLFHMSIEEADLAAAFRAARDYLVHVHLADSNRLVPGRGHTRFAEPLRALREIGFTGFGALECRVPEPREQSLRETVRFLRAQGAA
jgi:sugar phosphate isomerase/epimerase/uncharacterized protein (DUF952 family)